MTKKSHLDLELDESGSFRMEKFTAWISAYGKMVIYTLAALILLIVLLYRFSFGYQGRQELQFLAASNDFNTLINSNDPTTTSKALQRLSQSMQAHPELHASYDGAIAEILIKNGQIKEALPYATSALQRTENTIAPFYTAFSAATLLIEQGLYKEALEKANALKTQMIEGHQHKVNTEAEGQDKNFDSALFAMNLFRIGILSEQTHDATQELKTWHEWKQYAGLTDAKELPIKIEPSGFNLLSQQMAVGAFSLPDYIAYRESQLKKGA